MIVILPSPLPLPGRLQGTAPRSYERVVSFGQRVNHATASARLMIPMQNSCKHSRKKFYLSGCLSGKVYAQRMSKLSGKLLPVTTHKPLSEKGESKRVAELTVSDT